MKFLKKYKRAAALSEGILLFAAILSMEKGLFSAFILLLALAAVLSIPLLAAVYDGFAARLGKKRKNSPDQDTQTPLEQFFIPGKKRTGAFYEQIAEYKEVKKQLSAPYSFANASKSMRLARFCAAGVCFVLGLFLIVDAFGAPLSAIPKICVIPAAAVLFLFAACSLWVGFLRSLGAAAAFAGAAAFLYFIYVLLKFSLPRSLWLSACIVFLSFWTVAGVCYFISRRRMRKTATALFVYPFGEGWKGTDLDLKELLPVRGYAQFMTAVCDWEGSPDSLLKLIGEVQHFSAKKKIVFCGFELGGDGRISLFFYDRSRWGTDTSLNAALERKLRRESAAVRTVLSEDDEAWEYYRTDLYPDRQTLLDTEAENMDAMLENAGMDFSMPLRFGFTLLFAEKADSFSFTEAVREDGYRVDCVEDNTGEVAQNGLEREFSYSVNISRKNRAGGEHLKLLTADVRKIAERFHGQLLEWGLVDTFSGDAAGKANDANQSGIRGARP